MQAEELDLILDFLQTEQRNTGYPGLVGAIVAGDTLLWSGGFGVRELGGAAPVDGDTRFLTCSVSKLFVASLLQIVASQGLVGLDEPVQNHWPAIEVIPGSEAITFRHLVSHTAGLPLMPPLPEMAVTDGIPTVEMMADIHMPDMARLLESFPQLTLLAAPGERYEYSNIGIAILAQLLGEKLGLSYAEAVTQHILVPLGMKGATFAATEAQAGNFATGHFGFADPPAPLPPYDLGAFLPAGGLYASAADMGRFLQAQFASPVGYLTPAQIAEMWTIQLPFAAGRYGGDPGVAGIGLGWHITTLARQIAVEHGGADPAYSAFLSLVPSQQLGVFLAANSGVNPQAIADLSHEVLRVLL
ncbi:MAG: beta-lactamase family protein [Anaerolineales bacterium]|nr:beta-lactamase family protein [Anaerolineales bacterium]